MLGAGKNCLEALVKVRKQTQVVAAGRREREHEEVRDKGGTNWG